MELLCYVSAPTSRIRYTFDFIFEEVMGLSYRLTSSEDELKSWRGPKMTYHSSSVYGPAFHMPATGLLMESDLSDDLYIDIQKIDGLPAAFLSDEGDFKFDLPSFIFYSLTRYEEYTLTKRDQHERFISAHSAAVKHHYLDIPILDLWIARWGLALQSHFPDMSIPWLDSSDRKGKVQLTFDIDFPWAFQHRSDAENIGGGIKDVLRWDIINLKKRVQVMSGRSSDPYDQYDFIRNETEKRQIRPIFFLLNRGDTTFDRNHFVHKISYYSLLQKLKTFAELGVHPSYHAMTQGDLMNGEITLLKQLIDRDISKARMHFLRLKLPETYHLLLEYGIRTDYTMGYADRAGFRSGTSFRHPWFDLTSNSQSEMMIVPLICMDTTFHDYQKLMPEQAQKKMIKLMDWVWLMRGNCAILWHNSSLSDWGSWKGWRKVFIETLPDNQNVTHNFLNSIEAGRLILK